MVSAVDRVVVANGVRNITICKNTPHVGKPVYSCVRESLPRIMVARKMDDCSFLFSCSLSFTTVVTSSVCVLQLATVLEGEAVSVCVLCSLMNTCCENSTRVVAASNLSFSAHFCFLSASFWAASAISTLLFSFLSLQQSLMPTACLLLCFLGLFPSVATGHDTWDIVLVVRILMRLS